MVGLVMRLPGQQDRWMVLVEDLAGQPVGRLYARTEYDAHDIERRMRPGLGPELRCRVLPLDCLLPGEQWPWQ